MDSAVNATNDREISREKLEAKVEYEGEDEDEDITEDEEQVEENVDELRILVASVVGQFLTELANGEDENLESEVDSFIICLVPNQPRALKLKMQVEKFCSAHVLAALHFWNDIFYYENLYAKNGDLVIEDFYQMAWKIYDFYLSSNKTRSLFSEEIIDQIGKNILMPNKDSFEQTKPILIRILYSTWRRLSPNILDEAHDVRQIESETLSDFSKSTSVIGGDKEMQKEISVTSATSESSSKDQEQENNINKDKYSEAYFTLAKKCSNLYKLMSYNTRHTFLSIPKSYLLKDIEDIISNELEYKLFRQFLSESDTRVLECYQEIINVLASFDQYIIPEETDLDADDQTDATKNENHPNNAGTETENLSNNASKKRCNCPCTKSMINYLADKAYKMNANKNDCPVKCRESMGFAGGRSYNSNNNQNDSSTPGTTITSSDQDEEFAVEDDNQCEEEEQIKVKVEELQPFVDEYFNEDFMFGDKSPATDLEQISLKRMLITATTVDLLKSAFIAVREILERSLHIVWMPRFFASHLFNEYYKTNILKIPFTTFHQKIQLSPRQETLESTENSVTFACANKESNLMADNFEFYSNLSFYQENPNVEKHVKKINKKSENSSKIKENKSDKSIKISEKPSKHLKSTKSDKDQKTDENFKLSDNLPTRKDGAYTDLPTGMNENGKPRVWKDLLQQWSFDKLLVINSINANSLKPLITSQQSKNVADKRASAKSSKRKK